MVHRPFIPDAKPRGDHTQSCEPLVCTIGHSNRTIDAFIDLLRANGVARVIDVRTIPRSRHNPQFNLDSLPQSLLVADIAYEHRPGLGGLRHALATSTNTGWRNTSFRGYSDYMQTDAFADNVDEVVVIARSERCALMCAEAVPWRCHRSLIADALLVRGVCVEDIIGPHGRKPHALTPFAHVDGLHVTYPSVADHARSAANAPSSQLSLLESEQP